MANRLQLLNSCQSYTKKDPDMSQFNAISYEQELAAAGVAKEQAAVHARALGQIMTEVVCETQLREAIEQSERGITATIENLKIALTAKLEILNSRIDTVSARIESAREELIARLDGVRMTLEGRFASVEYELGVQRWLVGIVIALQIATIALTANVLIQ